MDVSTQSLMKTTAQLAHIWVLLCTAMAVPRLTIFGVWILQWSHLTSQKVINGSALGVHFARLPSSSKDRENFVNQEILESTS